jgi:hypothetical protein
MAMVDYDYYNAGFSGTIITDEDEFNRCLKKATVFLNKLTYSQISQNEGGEYGLWHGLQFISFTDSELSMLKNGLCGLTETIYQLSKVETQSLEGNENNNNIKTRSSGGESISYERQNTVYDEALKDSKKRTALYRSSLMEWIDVDAFRYNPFFAGDK